MSKGILCLLLVIALITTALPAIAIAGQPGQKSKKAVCPPSLPQPHGGVFREILHVKAKSFPAKSANGGIPVSANALLILSLAISITLTMVGFAVKILRK